MHLTEEELNEYLDNELLDRNRVELHLSACDECAERLAALQALFAEIESLPEMELTQSIAVRFLPSPGLPAQLPRWLTLTTTLQAVTAVIILIVAAPFVIQLILPYVSGMQPPSFAGIFLQLQSQWMAWLNIFSQIQLPALPEIPVVELSSLVIMFVIAGVSALWLVGNGLLLRNQIK